MDDIKTPSIGWNNLDRVSFFGNPKLLKSSGTAVYCHGVLKSDWLTHLSENLEYGILIEIGRIRL